MGVGYPVGWRRMSTSAAIKNNGATVVNAGNHDGSNVTSSLVSVGVSRPTPVVPGPRLRSGTIKPQPTGHWDVMVVGNYMVRGGSHMSTIGGVSKTLLNTSANLNVREKSINSLNWRTGFRIISWDLLTGLPTKGTVAVFNHFGNDTAVALTSAIPGRLVYREGNPTPTSANYQPRYLW